MIGNGVEDPDDLVQVAQPNNQILNNEPMESHLAIVLLDSLSSVHDTHLAAD